MHPLKKKYKLTKRKTNNYPKLNTHISREQIEEWLLGIYGRTEPITPRFSSIRTGPRGMELLADALQREAEREVEREIQRRQEATRRVNSESFWSNAGNQSYNVEDLEVAISRQGTTRGANPRDNARGNSARYIYGTPF